MKGYGAVGDARKRMLDGHENYSAEVWEERAQEQAHRASQAEAKYVALREGFMRYEATQTDNAPLDAHADELALLTEGAES